MNKKYGNLVKEEKKKNEKDDKKMYSFRLDVEITEAFIGACKKQGVKHTGILTLFMKDFVKEK